jgi:lipopolysaccharide transport system ATP-binding protein
MNAITVENLAKSYLLKHRPGQTTGYGSIRESLAHGVLNLKRKLQSKRYDQDQTQEVFWALQDVNLTIEQGERVAIIGRNGAGKSTLLKILSRITDPTCGSISINGRLSSLLEVGTGFHPELTGRENVFLNGAVMGMTRSEVLRKFDAIVAFSEVERFLDTPVKRYSSGMYVRLAFAVSAFLEPDIMVLDEVLSVGDTSFQKKCQAKMMQLATEGRTVLFVSHSMGAVRNLCDKGIVLSKGRASEKMPIDSAIAMYMREGARADDLEFPMTTDDVDCLAFDLQQYGLNSTEFEAEQPIDVEIRFKAHKSLTDFRIGFYLKTNLGDVVFRSLAADWNPQYANVAPGEYCLRAQIPANFLVPGGYLIEFHCSRFGIRDYFADQVTVPVRVQNSTRYNIQHPGEQLPGFLTLNSDWQWNKIAL